MKDARVSVRIASLGMILAGALLARPAAGGAASCEVRWHGSYEPAWTQTDWDAKAEALRRYIALVSQARCKCDYFLSPAEVECLSGQYPDVIDALRDSGSTINHSALQGHPTLDPLRVLKGQSWHEDVNAVRSFETHKVDPATGAVLDKQSGGLGLMQQLFGVRMVATGRFMRAPILAVMKEMGMRACFGFAEGAGGANGDVWFMGLLNIADAAVLDSSRDIVPWALAGGADPMGAAERALGRPAGSRPQRLVLVLRDTDFFLRRSQPEQEKVLAACADLLKRIVAKGIKPVDLRDILETAVDDREKSVTLATLDAIAANYTQTCTRMASDRLSPPLYLDVGGDYFSLADAFQLFQVALAWWKDARFFAPYARSRDVLGPTSYGASLSRQTSVKLADVVNAAEGLLNKVWAQVPSAVKVGSQEMNPAEFLYLMCRTYQRARTKPIEELGADQALPISVLPAEVRQNKKADDMTKLQYWTVKPVRWK